MYTYRTSDDETVHHTGYCTSSTIVQGVISIRARLRRDVYMYQVISGTAFAYFTVRTGGCELRSQWHSTGSHVLSSIHVVRTKYGTSQ